MDRRLVDEDVGALRLRHDEPEALDGVEPLHGALVLLLAVGEGSDGRVGERPRARRSRYPEQVRPGRGRDGPPRAGDECIEHVDGSLFRNDNLPTGTDCLVSSRIFFASVCFFEWLTFRAFELGSGGPTYKQASFYFLHL